MSDGMFKPLSGTGKTKTETKQETWLPIVPVPVDAPAPPAGHPVRGKPAASFVYHDATGAVLGIICRFPEPDGGKVYLPLSFCKNTAGKAEWRWKGFPEPRPLYGLDRLAANPDAPVLIVEGEKATEAACRLCPGYVPVTSPGGSKAAGKADWSPLAGRHVTIWPDADEPGKDYAGAVEKALRSVGAETVCVIVPPANVPEGWDIADAESEGWTADQAADFVRQAQPRTRPDSHAEKPNTQGGETESRKRGPAQRDILLDVFESVELWHSPVRDGYASITINGHIENWAIRSKEFKIWLTGQYFDRTGGAPGGQAIQDALNCLEAKAIHHCPVYPPYLRCGALDDVIYIDLGNDQWTAVQVSSQGWATIDRPPVKFIRPQAMQALPDPEMSENLNDLRELVNLRDDDDVYLLGAWMVAAMRPKGPYPILAINGEQGSSKSTLSRLVRTLIDPNASPIRSAPRDDRELVTVARNSWVIVLDNLSEVSPWLSDGLCRLATGGGFSARELYSDTGETIFEGQRPIILNGIPDLAARADLADRCIMLTLPAIPEAKRRAETDFWREFDDKAPLIFGALLDGVSGALRRLPDTKLDTLPRMADFALWATAAEYSLGWPHGAFMNAYTANRKGAIASSIEADPVAEAVLSLAEERDFEGTATGLLAALEDHTPTTVYNSRYWPSSNKLRGRLRRVQAPLRSVGVMIDFYTAATKKKERMISITMPERSSVGTNDSVLPE